MSKLAQKCGKCDFAPYLAEFIAAFVFVFIGAGSIIAASYFSNFDSVAIAAAHGFAIFIMVAATANVSGGHINPMVTLAAMLRAEFHGNDEKFKSHHGFGYIAAQLAGAAVGGGILYGLAHLMDGGETAAAAVNYGTPGLAAGLNAVGGFIYEAIFGFVLAFVILRTAMEDKHPWAPFAIGMTVFALALAGGSFTGAVMNPARWFGSAVISGAWGNAWIYILAPMIGAVIAVIISEIINEHISRSKS